MSTKPDQKLNDEIFQDKLIIDKPSNLGASERITRMSITLFFWLCLFYIWQPLISMVAWVFKIKLFYDHMIILGGYRSFLATITVYLIVILVLGGALIIWAKINEWRFSGMDRRTEMPVVGLEELAEYHSVREEDLEDWQSYRNARVYFDEENHVDTVEKIEKH